MKKQIKIISTTLEQSPVIKAKKTEISNISAMVEDSMKDWNPNSEKNYKGALRLLEEINQDNRDNGIKSKFKSELIQKALSNEPANFGVERAKIIKKDGNEGKELEGKIDEVNEFAKGIETEMKYTKIFEDSVNYLQGHIDSSKAQIMAQGEKIEKLGSELNSGIFGVINRLFGVGTDKK